MFTALVLEGVLLGLPSLIHRHRVVDPAVAALAAGWGDSAASYDAVRRRSRAERRHTAALLDQCGAAVVDALPDALPRLWSTPASASRRPAGCHAAGPRPSNPLGSHGMTYFTQLAIECKLSVKTQYRTRLCSKPESRARTFFAGLEVALNQVVETDLSGWWTGLIIGLVVVVAVVVVVTVLLVLASRINARVRAATSELEAAQTSTAPLVHLRRTNDTLQSILRAARAAREALGG